LLTSRDTPAPSVEQLALSGPIAFLTPPSGWVEVGADNADIRAVNGILPAVGERLVG
jgi:hypothetical protein